jgi:two-component system chemotaxis response regulator CheY
MGKSLGHAAADNTRRRLLAVDDDVASAELVGRIAARCGYDVRVTSSPKEVRDLLTEWQPDVLALDVCMPELDAVELLPILDEVQFSGDLLIVSGSDDQVRVSARKLASVRGIKVAGDIQKPLDVAALRKLLQGLHPAR